MPFLQAKALVQSAGFRGYSTFRGAVEQGNILLGVPVNPQDIYKDEWVSWRDWFGVEKPKYLPFAQAREWARASGIKNSSDWKQKAQRNKYIIPGNIPCRPNRVYANEWVSWIDWLGDSCCVDSNNNKPRKAYKKKDWLPFEQAREWARNSKITSRKEWKVKFKQKELQSGLPSSPYYVYRERWKGWNDFLGKS